MDWLAAKHIALKSVTPERTAVILELSGKLPLAVHVNDVADALMLTFPPAVGMFVVVLQFAPGEVLPVVGFIVCPGFSIHQAARSIKHALAIGSA